LKHALTRRCFGQVSAAAGTAAMLFGARRMTLAVSDSRIAPYREAYTAFENAMVADGLFVMLVEADESGAAAGYSSSPAPSLMVAIGSKAAAQVIRSETTTPLITTMTMASEHAELQGKVKIVGTVTLDLPPGLLLTALKQSVPTRTAVFVICDANYPSSLRQELKAQSARMGLALTMVECGKPKDVLDSLSGLRRDSDLMLCLPSKSLFPTAVVEAMIVASIRNRIPLAGFSPGFARAGAALSLFPDYQDIGVQTANLAKRILTGQFSGREMPRRVRVALNEKVLRLIGVPFVKIDSEVVLIR
jgi:putative ABC transport system substrate-binding protein